MALAYSPDGRWLAAQAADEKTVLLLDARTHETVARFGGHEDQVMSATFNPDSRMLATCSMDRTVRLWELDSGLCRVLRGHTDEVFAAAFHPDGTRLATAGRDRAVWLWDLATGQEVARLQGHTSYVWSLAFSPDGATLVSGSGDFTVRLWDTAPLKTRYQARREALALRPEAERLVDSLWRQKHDPAKVVELLLADKALSVRERHAAQVALLRRACATGIRKVSAQKGADLEHSGPLFARRKWASSLKLDHPMQTGRRTAAARDHRGLTRTLSVALWGHFGNKMGTGPATSAQCGCNIRRSR